MTSLALFEVAQCFRAEGSTGCSQWRKPLERFKTDASGECLGLETAFSDNK